MGAKITSWYLRWSLSILTGFHPVWYQMLQKKSLSGINPMGL